MTGSGTQSRLARARSATTVGIEAIPVEVEVQIRSGLPSFTVVGLPQTTVRESRDRVLSAIRAASLPVPRGAITVNLAPADVRKEGALFDLSLAAALLAAQGSIPAAGPVDDTVIVGELALDGRIRPVRGVLAVAIAAREHGYRRMIVPPGNAAEAAAVTGLAVFAPPHLSETVAVLRGRGTPWQGMPSGAGGEVDQGDLADVAGQGAAKRALEIAAAGRLHLLMQGPPGVGKSMLARRLVGLLPDLDARESLDASRVHSVAGTLTTGRGLLVRPPFRAPHHSVTRAGMVGGGQPPRPGELSLAHHGVLFLDELPEFRRSVLDALRQPIEVDRVTISRGGGRIDLPCRVILVAAMNPCPCGLAGRVACSCLPHQVRRYRHRVSGPVLDRVDLHIELSPVRMDDWTVARSEATATVRCRIEAARAMAAERSRVGASRDRSLPPPGTARRLLFDAVDRFGLSARAVASIQRVARTIADLAGEPEVLADHVAEAIQYRSLDHRLAPP